MPSEIPGFQHFIQHKLTILLIRRNNKARGRHAEYLLYDIHNTPGKLPQSQLLQFLLHPIDSCRRIGSKRRESSSSCRSHIPNSIPAVPSRTVAEVISPIASRRSHPAQFGETFDGPPSLERSGSEHREGAVTSPLPEEEGLGEKVELPLERETEGFEEF